MLPRPRRGSPSAQRKALLTQAPLRTRTVWLLLLLQLLLFLAFPRGGRSFIVRCPDHPRKPQLLHPVIKMVEGHGVARVAAAHRKLLLNHAFKATSPNGRFADGARLIDRRRLARIENVGKNLFYFFHATPQSVPSEIDPVVVHIHFGMSGAFTTSPLPGKTPTPTTRLLLVNEAIDVAASLSAMTVVHGGLELYESKYAALGPDPLREDADKERLWAKMQATSKPIGQILMDQSCVAGVGNIYRAEILFKSGVHPEQPARTIPRPTFEAIWGHSVLLLQRGFLTGSILTVDPEEARVLGPRWSRRYIYNQSTCGRCKGSVRCWTMAGRTVYACTTCQPLLPDTGPLPAARAAAVASARDSKEFVSHCAAEDDATMTPTKMTVAELTAALLAKGLPTTGRKPALVARLTEALAKEDGEKKPPATPEQQPAVAVVGKARPRGRPLKQAAAVPMVPMTPAAAAMVLEGVLPGTMHLEAAPASARSAAREKRRAGENRAVEHVALHDAEELQEQVIGVVGVVEEDGEDGAGGRKRPRRATVVVAGTPPPPAGAAAGAAAPAAAKGKGKKMAARRKTGGGGGAGARREWAAEVAVPGSAGLIDDVLAEAAAMKAEE